MLKRIIVIVVVAVVLMIAGGLAVVYYSGQKGEGAVEKWVGQQLQLIANSYLTPRLSFDSLDYQAPGTVRVTNFRLTADDAAEPGTAVDILAAREAVITLTEVPRFGEPILIERIALTEPVVRAIARGGSLVGFDNLLRVGIARPTTLPAGTPRLSEVFKFRRLEIRDGRFTFDPRRDGSSPMELDQIACIVEVQPGPSGQYQLEATFGRKPLVDGSAAGRLDIDTLRLSSGKLSLSGLVGPESLATLPTALQDLLRQYNARGSLEILVTGDVPLRDLSRTRLQAELKLAQAGVQIGAYQLPLDAILLQADLRDTRLNIRRLVASSIRGQVLMSGEIRLNDTLDSKLEAHGSGLRLDELELSADSGEKQLRGKLAANLYFEAPLRTVARNWPATRPAADQPVAGSAPHNATPLPRWGHGDIQLTDSRLVVFPVVSRFSAAVAKASRLGNPKPGQPSDRLLARFDLVGNRLEFSEIHYTDSVVGLRGRGSIGFDQQLDLLLNGGPIERVQDLLGRFGEAWGRVTDALIGYHVTGTISDPKVTVRPAPTVFGAIQRIGQAITGEQ